MLDLRPGHPHDPVRSIHRMNHDTLVTSYIGMVLLTLLMNCEWSEVKIAQACPILCEPMDYVVHHVHGILKARTLVKVKVAQLCLTLWDHTDYTVHGILQARIVEWVAIPFSRGSSQPRDWTWISHITGRFFTVCAHREAQWTNSDALLLKTTFYADLISSSLVLFQSAFQDTIYIKNHVFLGCSWLWWFYRIFFLNYLVSFKEYQSGIL